MNKFHYVYRISNKPKNKHYYGVRSCDIKPKDDLGKKYFSSSTDKEFIKEQKNSPSNFKYKIIKIFETRSEAIVLEIYLHSRFDVRRNPHFYNKVNQTSSGFDACGAIMTDKHKEALRAANLGNSHNLGRKHSPEVNARKASPGEKNGMYGKKHTEDTIKLISERIKFSKEKIHECLFCGKTVDKGNFNRWHGENCKFNPNITVEQIKKKEPWNKMKI